MFSPPFGVNCGQILDHVLACFEMVKAGPPFLPTETAREAIEISAMLRLPRALSRKMKAERVGDIIEQLDLGSCQHTRIGDERLRGISGESWELPSHVCSVDEATGGEKKRAKGSR